MGWLNKRKASKTTIYYLAQEKPVKNQPTKKVSNSIIAVGQFEDNFKKYFADPIDVGSVKRNQLRK